MYVDHNSMFVIVVMYGIFTTANQVNAPTMDRSIFSAYFLANSGRLRSILILSTEKLDWYGIYLVLDVSGRLR